MLFVDGRYMARRRIQFCLTAKYMLSCGFKILTFNYKRNKSKTIMEILKAKTHHFDIEELACKILGLDYDEIDADTQVIEDKMSEEFYIDLDTFQEIVSRLLPLVDVGASELTGTRFKGFADVKNKMWLVKTEVSN